MNIGIDIRTLMDKQYSGVPEHTLNLIKAIIRLEEREGRDNRYKLFYNALKDPVDSLPSIKSDKIEVKKLGYPNKIFNYLFQKTFRHPKIDKFLGVEVFLMPHINFAALSPGCSSVLTVHDISFLRYPEFFNKRKNFWHFMINVKKLINGFDHIVAVSSNTKNDLVDVCGVKEDKVTVIYPGLDQKLYTKLEETEKNKQDLEKIRAKYGLNHKFFFYMGNLEPRKNIEGLLRAFDIFCHRRKDTDFRLVVAGGKGWKSDFIMDTWKRCRYRDRVNFLGYVPREDKPYLYNAATALVYPSFYEGFGFPPLEAMACGTPVLTSFASSLPEVTGEAALLVDPYNTYKIAYYMEQLAEKDALKRHLINKGFARAEEYHWDLTARRYMELLESIPLS